MTVSERQPCRAGSAWKLGQFRMVKPGTKPASSSRVGAAQQMADEEPVPGELGDDADVQPVGGVGAGVEVLHEELGAADVLAHVGEKPVEGARAPSGRCSPTRRAARPRARGRRTCPWGCGRYGGRWRPGRRRRGRGRPRRGRSRPALAQARAGCSAPRATPGKPDASSVSLGLTSSCTLNTVVMPCIPPPWPARRRPEPQTPRPLPQRSIDRSAIYNTRSGAFDPRDRVNADPQRQKRGRSVTSLLGSVFGCVRIAREGKGGARGWTAADGHGDRAWLGGGLRRPRAC